MFSNVDVLTQDKIAEIRTRLTQMKDPPQVIVMQEVRPKHLCFERFTTEYVIDQYPAVDVDLQGNIGRGLIIYIKKGTTYNVIEMKTEYCEYCSVEIKGSNKNLLLTSIYRNPNNSDQTT